MVCMICGGEEDLAMAVLDQLVCAICTTRFVGGQRQTVEAIDKIRRMMGLGVGEYYIQDRSTEAKKTLGRG